MLAFSRPFWNASALAFSALLDAPTLCHKRAQPPCHELHRRAPHGLRPCANVRRVGAPTRGRRSLRNNRLDDADEEQLRSAAGEGVALELDDDEEEEGGYEFY